MDELIDNPNQWMIDGWFKVEDCCHKVFGEIYLQIKFLEEDMDWDEKLIPGPVVEEEEELSEEEHREEGIAIVDGVERRCTIEKLDVEGSEGLSQNSCQHRVFYGG